MNRPRLEMMAFHLCVNVGGVGSCQEHAFSSSPPRAVQRGEGGVNLT